MNSLRLPLLHRNGCLVGRDSHINRLHLAGLGLQVKGGIGTLVGGAIVVFVIANVQLGMVAPLAVEGADDHKLDVMMMADPSCGFETVENDLETMGASYCLGEAGQWSGADILMLLEGLVIVLAGRLELPQNKAWANRVRSIGKVVGWVFIGLALLDRLSLLPSSANSQSLADFFPIETQAWLVQLAFAAVGVFLIRGPKYWEAEAVAQTRDKLARKTEKAEDFKSSFYNKERHSDKELARVNRSRFLQQDKGLSMKKRRKQLLVMATCPYCQGGGCKRCNEFGVF